MCTYKSSKTIHLLCKIEDCANYMKIYSLKSQPYETWLVG